MLRQIYGNFKRLTTHQIQLLGVLMVMMILTRYHHFGDMLYLPDASWALFFLGGYGIGHLPGFVLLFTEAAVIDFSVTQWAGVSDWCLSPAYGFLVPAYGVLWWGGGCCARITSLTLKALPIWTLGLLLSTALAFLFSNLGFYLFSGKFELMSGAQYSARVFQYYPAYLKTALGYVVTASLIYTFVFKTKFNKLVRNG